MKKRMRLLITCMTFIIMSTFAVNATEVSSGNVMTVSGGNTVSGNDIPTQGNISDYLFRYADENDGFAFIGSNGVSK